MEVRDAVTDTLRSVVLNFVFDDVEDDYQAWRSSPQDVSRLIWEAKTERKKLSLMAEVYFRKLAEKLRRPMLLTKGEFHRLVPQAAISLTAQAEINTKLDLLADIFEHALKQQEAIERTNAEGEPLVPTLPPA